MKFGFKRLSVVGFTAVSREVENAETAMSPMNALAEASVGLLLPKLFGKRRFTARNVLCPTRELIADLYRSYTTTTSLAASRIPKDVQDCRDRRTQHFSRRSLPTSSATSLRSAPSILNDVIGRSSFAVRRSADVHSQTPFTRYIRLNVCLHDAAVCSNAVVKPHKRLNNRLNVCIHDTAGCPTGCQTG